MPERRYDTVRDIVQRNKAVEQDDLMQMLNPGIRKRGLEAPLTPTDA